MGCEIARILGVVCNRCESTPVECPELRVDIEQAKVVSAENNQRYAFEQQGEKGKQEGKFLGRLVIRQIVFQNTTRVG